MATNAGSPLGRITHNLSGGGISERIFGDFSAAEHRYLERRQWEVSNEIQRENGRKLDQVNAQMAQLNARAEQANQIALAQLQQQHNQLAVLRDQLELQIREAERTAHQRIKEDHRAFAAWRQTPDGRRFVEWCDGAGSVLRFVEHFTAVFNDALRALVAATVTEEELRAAETGEWTPHSEDYARGRRLIRAGLILAGVALPVSLVRGWFGLVIILGLAVAAVGAAVKRRETGWAERNARAREEVRRRHLGILGYDPLGDDPAPGIFPDAVYDYVDELVAAADRGFEYHTAPAGLPRLALPGFVARAEIGSPVLREVHDRCTAQRRELEATLR
ncbi:hypothetical protein CSPHI_10670 [Corynebacterium sphenisci DSM 44792]|uniref:Uncharacterized protein n=1 Tax=Corynebacterium sphenisci DSM 44792 TaxID=1437874 RepID=A0A1L7CZR0_9CORY|nr:hypothetical protein [Corynebacterium sphenisci]APT91376.1 hypothetical protein CSPHI_10670 [Corynebacterium sphenisci DSM 44792]